MSHPLTWRMQDLGLTLQPATRGRSECFGFTFGEQSYPPSLYSPCYTDAIFFGGEYTPMVVCVWPRHQLFPFYNCRLFSEIRIYVSSGASVPSIAQNRHHLLRYSCSSLQLCLVEIQRESPAADSLLIINKGLNVTNVYLYVKVPHFSFKV